MDNIEDKDNAGEAEFEILRDGVRAEFEILRDGCARATVP